MLPVVRKMLLAGTILSAGLVGYLWRDTFESDSLKGARVLVTGASTGIGEQMAYHYARFGAQVVITARRGAVLKQVAEKCLKLGAEKALYIAADMAEPTDPDRVIKFAAKSLGGLDYLVLNHIGPSPFQMWNGDVDHARWLMQVNYLSYIEMTNSAMPFLKQSNGSIVVVSSIAGMIPTPFTAPYSATKFALNGFFGTLRQELSMKQESFSITVCILGMIDTDSALSKVRGMVEAKAYPASEAALAIIKGGATRQREVYYPGFWQPVCLIRDWFPGMRDRVIQSTYNYKAVTQTTTT
ncbi:hydroxysteroid 11-beta-dehydrogenase 1-like protein [Acipenser oxyrinchus oxyrinchus]|uniref:Hydroxysteroid 11-beta-dehydrogenase 1-like protein n=1 Tax=Acipenser oxyrinchus oxyrinchus TaxID=40147 RepID=A0AAD8CUU1_ACIOX|nr:hydroxysteroid 11-beta-dehydrogenase 1-like protein [Acipenser oxyrinchus oxyrinchus]